ncbi:hypothetical protein [Vampirovibrio chlorellavorus]|uniref:hypothetical protein n=1 Tax=Vampirovibrio chlorellavorus TaxID=758823 RepID=UPI0026EFC137|nr:hypothetical protein [Vampirovibrio chlorellavorus]
MPEYSAPSWQNLLRGGFAYETAYFAIHPCDRERALKMYYMALVENISLDEIKAYAATYLQSRGVIPEGIEEHLSDVERFYNSIKLPKIKRKVWLITWEYDSEDRPLADRIIAVKSLQVNPARVAEFIEQHYMATQYSTYQKSFFSTRPKLNPYQAVFPNPDSYLQIYCGRNPKIYARIVQNYTVEIKDGKEHLFWEEIDHNMAAQS